VAAGADSRNQAWSQVESGWNAEAVPGLDGAAPREESIEPNFTLEFLLNLRTSGNRRRPREYGDRHHRLLRAHLSPGD
jgi:hypothetical protein